MFEDEAGFGRINKPKRCWCSKKTRPSVPCHHIREYRYAFGGVEPTTGDHFFLVLPRCDTDCMNVFLAELSKEYPKDRILLVCDGASWHKSKGLKVPENYSSNLWYDYDFLKPYADESTFTKDGAKCVLVGAPGQPWVALVLEGYSYGRYAAWPPGAALGWSGIKPTTASPIVKEPFAA